MQNARDHTARAAWLDLQACMKGGSERLHSQKGAWPHNAAYLLKETYLKASIQDINSFIVAAFPQWMRRFLYKYVPER